MADDRTLAGFVSGEDDTAFVAPPRIGARFEVQGLIGAGAMGTVYRVKDTDLDEIVALKLLKGVRDPAAVARFRQEVKLARRVTHPNVVRTFDLGEHLENGDVVRYLTMAYVDGPSLAKVIADHGPLPTAMVVGLAAQIAAGVAAAHEAGVLHRDLKPDNVLVAGGDRALITDFGIARAQGDAGQTGTIVGTPAYMAPEQVRGGDVDGRADLYAIGAIVFEMATGRRAFPGTDPLAVATARLFGAPPDPRAVRPGLDDALVNVILRAMALDPADRFPTATALLAALQAVQAGTTSSGPRPRLGLPHASTPILAVLPFRDVGPPGEEWVASGLSEDLLDALSRVHGLRVAPLHATAADPRQAGSHSGAHAVFEGTVRRTPDGRWRLGARLIGVVDGFQLWTRRVDGDASELLAEIPRLCSEIGDALAVHVQGARRGRMTDPAAVELYLKARARSRSSDPVQALPLLEQALSIAPDDPAILSAYATALTRVLFVGSLANHRDPNEILDRAEQAAARAVALSPDLGEPWTAIATVRSARGDLVGTARAVKTAITLAPGLVRAHEMMAWMTLEAGRLQAGVDRLEMCRSLDPQHLAQHELTRGYALLGRWADVDAMLDLFRRDTPAGLATWIILRGRFAMWSGRRNFPKEEFPAKLLSSPLGVLYVAARALNDGKPLTTDVVAVLDGNLAPRTAALVRQITAEILAGSGQVDAPLDHLEIALKGPFFDLGWMDCCPAVASLRGHPRWAAIRAEVAARADAVMAAFEGPPEVSPGS